MKKALFALFSIIGIVAVVHCDTKISDYKTVTSLRNTSDVANVDWILIAQPNLGTNAKIAAYNWPLSPKSTNWVENFVDHSNHNSFTLGGTLRAAWPLESRLQVYPMYPQSAISSNYPQRLNSNLIVSNQYYNAFPCGIYNPQTRLAQSYWMQLTQHGDAGSILRSLSRDNGNTWSTPQVVKTEGSPTGVRYRYFSPLRLPDGRLFSACAFFTNSHYASGYMVSTNDGEYWTDPVQLPEPVSGLVGIDVSVHPLLLQSGALVVPCIIWHTNDFTGTNITEIAGAYRSGDYGTTWTWYYWKTNRSEVSVRETFDKQLIGLFRGPGGPPYGYDTNLWRAVSTDDGLTFGNYTSLVVSNSDLVAPPPNSLINIGFKWLLATRDATTRQIMFQSHDNGYTWEKIGQQYIIDSTFQMADWIDFGGGKIGLLRSQADLFSSGPALVFVDMYDISIPNTKNPDDGGTPVFAYMPSSLAGKADVDRWVDLGMAGETLTNFDASYPPNVGIDGNAWFNGVNHSLIAQTTNAWSFLHNGGPFTFLVRCYVDDTSNGDMFLLDTSGGSSDNAGFALGTGIYNGSRCMMIFVGRKRSGEYVIRTDAGAPSTNISYAITPTNQWETLALRFDSTSYKFYIDGQRLTTVYTNGNFYTNADPATPLRLNAVGSSYYRQGISHLMMWTSALSDDAIARWTDKIQTTREVNQGPTVFRSTLQP